MTQPMLREATERDAPAVADLSFAASYHDALRAGVVPPLEDLRAARDIVAALWRIDPFAGLVAEVDGALVAAGWTHVRGRVSAVGPFLVAPAWRGRGVGSALLAALAQRAGRGAAQVRMLCGVADPTALAVSLRAGFRVVAPVVALELPAGRPCDVADVEDGTILRTGTTADRWHVVERDARSFGARREADVDEALGAGRVVVAERAGRVVGYALAQAIGGTLLVGAAAADDPGLALGLVAHHVVAGRLRGGAARILVPAADQRLVDLALLAGFRVQGVRAYLVRGGGTVPPKGYLLMPLGRC